jgi:hypothetical protein
VRGVRRYERAREGAKGKESFRWLTLKVEGKKSLSNDFIVNSSGIYRREKGDVIE